MLSIETSDVKLIECRWSAVGALAGMVQDRTLSQIYRLERVAGCGIIAPRRTNSAHLHRPWRATARKGTLPRPPAGFRAVVRNSSRPPVVPPGPPMLRLSPRPHQPDQPHMAP